MRKIYLTMALAAFTLVNADAQIIFSSSMETWASGMPTDWGGAYTNITTGADPGVSQVTGSSMYGTNAARLTNTSTTTHKRLTTQGVGAITNGTNYMVKFYAKGTGKIRTGLMDSRPGSGFGYFYNPYITLSSSTWTAYTQFITCANDTTGAQFILSVLGTTGPDHVMIDSVVITVATPTAATIYDIQYTTAGDGSSPLVGATVNTGGIVTAVASNGYFLQSGAGAWRGIQVFDFSHTPALGDSIALTASVEEYFGNTQLSSVSAYSVVNTGNALPGPTVITTVQGNTEDYEGVFSQVTSVCKDVNAGFGMWSLYTSPDTLKVNDFMYAFTPTMNATYKVTGVMEYSYSEFKIDPRMASDIVLITGVKEESKFDGLHLYPNPADQMVSLAGLPANSTVQVVDLTGQTIMTVNTSVLNTAELSNGAYLVKVTNANSVKTFKLVVKH
jgi:hypothetical protein